MAVDEYVVEAEFGGQIVKYVSEPLKVKAFVDNAENFFELVTCGAEE